MTGTAVVVVLALLWLAVFAVAIALCAAAHLGDRSLRRAVPPTPNRSGRR